MEKQGASFDWWAEIQEEWEQINLKANRSSAVIKALEKLESQRNIVHNGNILEGIFSWRHECLLTDNPAVENSVCYLVRRRKESYEYAQMFFLAQLQSNRDADHSSLSPVYMHIIYAAGCKRGLVHFYHIFD